MDGPEPSFTHEEPQDSTELKEVDAQNYYAILNVGTDASTEEVKNAYKKIVLVFHPDKFSDQEKRDAAQRKFLSIQRAHEVLSDPALRYIYDLYGEKGLETSWEIGAKFKSKEEVYVLCFLKV